MRTLIIELSNRCNLACQHCFSGRHGGRDALSVELVEKILAQAAGQGFTHANFTGGEPTLHGDFLEMVRLSVAAGYDYSFNSNGWNFGKLYPRLLPYREQLRVITFSIDGATEASHDRVRGKDSFRRLMQACSICVSVDLPFTFNMTVTRDNWQEIERMGELAESLGAKGLRYGHLMPTESTTALGWELTPSERNGVDARIWHLRDSLGIAISIAAGHHTTDLFPCKPLHLDEVNIDCLGRLTKCCMLSSHEHGATHPDVIADLTATDFATAFAILAQENASFSEAKLARLRAGSFADSDYFPCWYCSKYYGKVEWLRGRVESPWSQLIND